MERHTNWYYLNGNSSVDCVGAGEEDQIEYCTIGIILEPTPQELLLRTTLARPLVIR
ncbi:MAG TPA: hypothetical protein VF089_06245 [Candidatus Binatia bacterium]